jgi:hypothetical protein
MEREITVHGKDVSMYIVISYDDTKCRAIPYL